MAVATGTVTIKSHVYDMTGTTSFSPSAGVDLGGVSDLVLVEFERDVQLYTKLESGSAPAEASIDGSGCILEFSLSEYDAAAVAFLTQRIQKSGTTINWHGVQDSTYEMGTLLDSNKVMRLLVADVETPANHLMLHIPRAVIVRIRNLSLSPAEGLMNPATIQIVGLHDDTANGPFEFGDVASFASRSGGEA